MTLSNEEFSSLGFTFVWRIENFSHCLEKRNCCIESPSFAPEPFHRFVWNMKIYPRGNERVNCITYKVSNDSMLNRTFCFELAIIGSDGSLTNLKELENFSSFLLSFSDILIEKEELFGEKKDFYLPQDTLTLNLRLWHDLPSWWGQTLARTRIGVQKRAIIWKIPQFSGKKPSEDNKIFEIKQNFIENITLNLQLKNCFKCNKIHYLEISETDISHDNLISIEIAVLDLSGSRTHLCTSEHWFDKRSDEKIWKLPNSILMSSLLTNKNLYLPNDTLTFQCDLALLVVVSKLEFVEVGPGKEKPYMNSLISEIHPPQRKAENVSELQESLATDLLNLYTEGANFDFELRADSSKFPVHKLILMARSPVFRGMLSSDMIEKNANMVDIPDLDCDTVKRMLDFIILEGTAAVLLEK
ncbi:hypothetical protein JTE90_010545 [Oedothorax gibbosus]|uniref:BTB domain-containing protein n=1 Tax=Oedothorax gibbosus TaxID=931172 RepID=A0AAV6U3V6_9ARAC|nr:hypothetical protein JTE90_010545 [Oedothorax gibbosus]